MGFQDLDIVINWEEIAKEGYPYLLYYDGQLIVKSTDRDVVLNTLDVLNASGKHVFIGKVLDPQAFGDRDFQEVLHKYPDGTVYGAVYFALSNVKQEGRA